ncbi:transposable element Tcb2 transposase [Trichonephila clavipes]|uniref:Transposable element Tcb2 transposase n=1 Tax=Trichonephila clavipes TaxID=2585209 RepID=A0A8X6RJY4_TRICX|nr:transposable element Tcb2 transposase [Trichonephila clavipes]
MMEDGWSARRVTRQLGRSDCVVRRFWDQRIREMSFTRRPDSGRPRQTIRREDWHIIRNARVQPTTSLAPSRHRCSALQAHKSTPPFGVMPRTRKLDCSGMEPGRLCGEYGINLISDDNCFRVWKPRGERLNPASAL